jgi:small subunit ribosomal protein S9
MAEKKNPADDDREQDAPQERDAPQAADPEQAAEPEAPGQDSQQGSEPAETPVAAEALAEDVALAEDEALAEGEIVEAAAGPQAAEPATAEPAAAEPAAAEALAEDVALAEDEALAEGEIVEAAAGPQAAEPVAAAEEATASTERESDGTADDEPAAPRVKPAVPGAHLEVDIVPEGVDPLGREEEYRDPYAIAEEDLEPAVAEQPEEQQDEALSEPIASAAIDLAAGARYRATGKRKTAIARVTLRPGSGTYVINGRSLEEHFPRATLQRNIRQPLETVGYQERMDVVARLHGGGISAQAGALRHGVSRALLEADPNLRGELKRRGFLTRDSRAKERKKAGLKKARKRPQFSKR